MDSPHKDNGQWGDQYFYLFGCSLWFLDLMMHEVLSFIFMLDCTPSVIFGPKPTQSERSFQANIHKVICLLWLFMSHLCHVSLFKEHWLAITALSSSSEFSARGLKFTAPLGKMCPSQCINSVCSKNLLIFFYGILLGRR